MDQARGVLLLTDPLRAERSGFVGGGKNSAIAEQFRGSAGLRRKHADILAGSGERQSLRMRSGQGVAELEFREDERCLPQAQAALWELRRRCGWICVVAEGAGAGVALALAAQLPVDRVALIGETPLAPLAGHSRGSARARELIRVNAFARRNLALVIAEILLVGADEAQRRRLIRGLGRADGVRWMDGGARLRDCVEPWGITENNLRI